MGAIGKILKILREVKIKYLFHGSYIRVEKGSVLNVGENVILKKTKLYIQNHSEVRIESNVSIINSNLHVNQESNVLLQKNAQINNVKGSISGQLIVEKYAILTKGNALELLQLNISTGSLVIGRYAMIRCYRILIRFGGELTIGAYTNINEGSEIRADEYVTIGSYNQISFNCMIWDTNTHNIYSHDKRQQLTREKFPNFGYEYEKPKTKPIHIGNDCWIGRDATVLKGSIVGNKCVIGYRTTIVGEQYADNTTIVSTVQNTSFTNKI